MDCCSPAYKAHFEKKGLVLVCRKKFTPFSKGRQKYSERVTSSESVSTPLNKQQCTMDTIFRTKYLFSVLYRPFWRNCESHARHSAITISVYGKNSMIYGKCPNISNT